MSTCTRAGDPNCSLSRKRPASWYGQTLQVTATSHSFQLLSAVRFCIRNLSVSSNFVTTTLEAWTGTASSLLSDLVAVAPSIERRPVFESTLRTLPESGSALRFPPTLFPPCAKSPRTTRTVSPTRIVTERRPARRSSGLSKLQACSYSLTLYVKWRISLCLALLSWFATLYHPIHLIQFALQLLQYEASVLLPHVKQVL